jgi:hypothetical protein
VGLHRLQPVRDQIELRLWHVVSRSCIAALSIAPTLRSAEADE